LGELAEYRKIHRNCNVIKRCSKHIQLGSGSSRQGINTDAARRKEIVYDAVPYSELERLGFEWDFHAAWETV
jgi:hypothetical protein